MEWIESLDPLAEFMMFYKDESDEEGPETKNLCVSEGSPAAGGKKGDEKLCVSEGSPAAGGKKGDEELPRALPIFIQTPCGKTINLDVGASASIDHIKEWMQTAVGAPPAEQILVQELKDGCTISDYNTQNESLHLVMLLRGRIKIFVKTLTGNTITLHVKRSDRVSIVKGKVFDIEGIPPSQQKLFFDGTELVDEFPFDVYGIRKGSTLHVEWMQTLTPAAGGKEEKTESESDEDGIKKS